ncbi:MAG: RNA methyltransferase [Atopobiaceae bacterium]|nr:RNA methyltransferase [Atopobiaceae bacterium]
MAIIRLDAATDGRLDVFCALTNHQLRNSVDPARGIVVVESQIAIRVAVGQGLEPVAFLLDERRVKAMADVLDAIDDDVPVFVLPAKEAEKLTGYAVTRGALCAMRRPVAPTLGELLDGARNVVVLESITDTSNVGAIFRNAAALGADAVIAAPTCADPLARRSVRVSMGNVFMVPWLRMGMTGTWVQELMEALAKRGFVRMAMALGEESVSIDSVDKLAGERRALFFGSEGSGLSEEVLRGCDLSVIIPMRRGVDSLNVAASSAIAMWQLF